MGRVSFGLIIKQVVSLAYVFKVQIGDYVLVHLGFASIDRTKVELTLNYLEQITEDAQYT